MSTKSDGVILLHGLGRSSRSMARLAQAIADSDYRALNLDYPSRTHDLAGCAAHVHAASRRWIAGLNGSVHVVTHSMGGLVARALITGHRPPNLGRVVMLAPPNQGSEIADLLRRTRAYRRAFGPAGAQLTTQRPPTLDALLGPIDYPLGVIAADRAIDPLGWAVLPKPNDGKVSVARTKVLGMADHIIVPATHTFIMAHPAAVAAVLTFLSDGRFAGCRLRRTAEAPT